MIKVLVTGAGGGLGQAFLRIAPGDVNVHPFSREQLDVGDHDAVVRTVRDVRPEAILSFGAMTRVDTCEQAPELAYRTNALGPHSLALAARDVGAMLLHVSTDYVFDGEKMTAYDELDPTNPISVYGRSKLGGERFVSSVLPEHFIVRTGYVFGSGKDYLSSAVARLARGQPAGALADRIGTPTYVRHLAQRILPLLRTERFGTYHVAGSEPAAWFDVLTRIRFLAGYPVSVERQEAASLGLPAPRPRNSALTSIYTHELGLDPLPPLDVALKEMLDAN